VSVYLVETPACRQTREQIHEFMEKYKTYKLAKAEILNVINVAPRELVEIDPVLKVKSVDCRLRFLEFRSAEVSKEYKVFLVGHWSLGSYL
ncbi:hypothetical protein P3X46_028173, partial [Hevea brasiliensis]